MPTTETQLGAGSGKPKDSAPARGPVAHYGLTFVESPGIITSLREGLRDYFHGPKITVSSKYYKGEARLPITEMKPWWADLPDQIKAAFEKPRDPIGIFNRRQEKKRALFGAFVAIALAGGGAYLRRPSYILLGAVLGYMLGEMAGVLVFKKRAYPPETWWRDYQPQSGSWVNSVLVHVVMIAALILPYYISQMFQPVKAATTSVVDISPYMPQLPPSPKQAGGGGGGGDRSPTPATKGRIPRFSKVQLAPPVAKILVPHPKLPVTPTLLGPPELKLPQMAMNGPFGDPMGVNGPPSNGPGTGGGIGSGNGTGIGPGTGAGLGPGSGGGTGGGPFSVGGGVSAPIAIYKPEPPYSEEARKAKYQGTVVLWIVVDSEGRVTDAQVVKPLGMGLDEKAVDTVRTWKFIPAKRNGQAVPVKVMVEVSFRLF